MADTINKMQKALLSLLSNSLFGKENTIEEDVEWKWIFDESKKQAVATIVYDAVGEKLPDELKSVWHKYSMNNILQNSAIHSYHTHLHELMTANNIDYCILKGCSSDYYYPQTLLRAMGDVDFLVKKEDIPKATKVLENDGFMSWNKEHICHIVLKNGKMHFEMHFEPAGVPDGKARELVLSYLDDIFTKSVLVTTESATFMKPSDFHHGLIIFLHTYHHLLAEGVGLRHLCDMAVFFNKFSNDDFTELFEEKMIKLGLWKFIRIMGMVSHKYLGIEYRDWMGHIDEKLVEDLMVDILNGGNFGKKDSERSKQGIAISNRGKDGVHKSTFIQTISSLNRSAYPEFNILRKYKIFKPFGWIFLLTRYSFRVLTGKRKIINVHSVLSGAEKRKEIYKQFELFENTEDS